MLEALQYADAKTRQLPRAVLLCRENLTADERNLARVLDLFGVPWGQVDIREGIGDRAARADSGSRRPYCVVASASCIAEAMHGFIGKRDVPLPTWIQHAKSVYVFAFENTDPCRELLRCVTRDEQATVRGLDAPRALVSVARNLPELCGPLSGMEINVKVTDNDRVFDVRAENPTVASIAGANGGVAFLSATHRGVPFYLNACRNTIDISSPATKYFDVRDHFFSAVPLAMYLQWEFREVCWTSAQNNACLIVDDPPLHARYGFLRFRDVLELMDEQNFTMSLAFIPWNWRRTNRGTVRVFQQRPDRLSIAVHGCDHAFHEFATRSDALLNKRIRTARERMQSLRQRTTLQHDRIMIFPQGAFSAETGRALKLNGFAACVNTEVVPLSGDGNETTIGDLWDLAIMKYGTFPMFTRRYLHHGIENFAFDALIGKPCFLAAHHDAFKNNAQDLVDFVYKLNSLKWDLHWRTLGDAIRHSFRVRNDEQGSTAIQMYAESLTAENRSGQPLEISVAKKESDPDSVSAVVVNEKAIAYAFVNGCVRFTAQVPPNSAAQLEIVYFDSPAKAAAKDGLAYRAKVRARRYFSEFRDNYLSRSDLLHGGFVKARQLLS